VTGYPPQNAVDLKPLVTHRFKLDQIEQAYDLFAHQRDGVLSDELWLGLSSLKDSGAA
jgi:hypothetical protein